MHGVARVREECGGTGGALGDAHRSPCRAAVLELASYACPWQCLLREQMMELSSGLPVPLATSAASGALPWIRPLRECYDLHLVYLRACAKPLVHQV